MVGVPLTVTVLPLLELRSSPTGRLPALIDQLYGAVPPDAVQVAEYDTADTVGPVARVQLIFRTVVAPGLIVMDNGLCGRGSPLLSFTVTLKLNGLPDVVVGVPLIEPVEALSVKPGGKDPELAQLLVRRRPSTGHQWCRIQGAHAPAGQRCRGDGQTGSDSQRKRSGSRLFAGSSCRSP